MIIDGHSHVNLSVQKHLELMNQAGVDKTVLFSTSIHPETAMNFSGIQKEMQRLNEIIAGNSNVSAAVRLQGLKEQKETIAMHPSRYIGFGSIPRMLDEQEINDYIEKEVVRNGFVGLGENIATLLKF